MVSALDIKEMARKERKRREAARAVESLAAFVRHTWSVLEPGANLKWNWHIQIICDELEAVTRGETKELVICIPPGFLKSRLVSVMWPAFEWLHKPWTRAIYVSSSDDLAKRDSLYTRQLIQSEEYQQCIQAATEKYGLSAWSLDPSQNEKHHFANTQHGFRQALSMGAGVTGKRGDKLVIDDPLDAKETVIGTPEQVTRRMEECVSNYDHVLASRLNDPENNPRVTIAQRLAPNDLPGVLIRRGVRHVVLPLEYERGRTDIHPDDPRTEDGELLFPDRMGRGYVEGLKSTPGASRHYQAQYQQSPPPLGGGIFRQEWFQYYENHDGVYHLGIGRNARRIPESDCWRMVVVDTALTERTLSDFTVVQVWDVVRRHERNDQGDSEQHQFASEMVLLDQWRGQVTAPEVEQRIQQVMQRWGAQWAAIEHSTASLPIIQRFQRDGVIVKGLKPKDYGGDKVSRAQAASIWMEAGKLYFPSDKPWLSDLEAELMSFPGGEHDDMCDALAYAVLVAADRDAWMDNRSHELPRNSLGHILGMDEIFNPEPEEDAPAFTLDRSR